MRSNLFWIWDYRWFRVHIFCFSFPEEKPCWRKKQPVQDRILPPSIYIHMCTLYIYTYTHIPRFSPSGFFGPSRCLMPTPGLTTEYPICTVCACVRIHTHIHPHTLPPALKIEHTQTTPLSFLLSKITPTPSNKCPHSLAEPPHPRSPTLNEQTALTWAHMCTLQRACTQICMLMSQHLFSVHTCTCMVLRTSRANKRTLGRAGPRLINYFINQ